jgi:hypothetical protein
VDYKNDWTKRIVMFCKKCGIENEDNSKFCTGCGAELSTVQASLVSNKKTSSIVKTALKAMKIIAIALVSIFVLIMLVLYIQSKNEDRKIVNLRAECVNNNADACYEFGSMGLRSTLWKSEKFSFDEQEEAIAKSCNLGNVNACRTSKYYQQACDLHDGASCYLLAKDISNVQGITGTAACNINEESDECKLYKKYNIKDIDIFYKKACEYGYSQGCMENR